MTEKWTAERWKENVLINSNDSYSLTVCTAALMIAEHPGEDSQELLTRNFPGMSGFQADCARGLAERIPPEVLEKGAAL